MNHPERDFYNWLRPKLVGHVQRIENSTNPGMPDLNICYQGQEVWVELKVAECGVVKLRKEQFAWMWRRTANEGSCWVIAGETINNEYKIFIWSFINLKVTPCGTTAIFVRITSPPYKVLNSKDLGEFLKTNLFTPSN